MMYDEEQLRALLERPAEALQVELKTWLDTSSPEGQSKVVRAIFAIRNRNGGFVVVGFHNETLNPEPYDLAERLELAYHVDRIQGLVSRYAAEAFEVEVVVREHLGQKHPVIVIPSGVQVPAVVKRDLMGDGGKKLLSKGAIYFRTLQANGTPSTASIQPADYSDLLTICFDNREADIGRFVRRQLAGIDLSALAGLLGRAAVAPPPDLRARTLAALGHLAHRYGEAIALRHLTKEEASTRDLLTMEVAMVLEPQRPDEVPTREFMNRIGTANPNYTGWPAWMDTRSFRDEADRPIVVDGGWEAILSDLEGGWSRHFEFLRFDPRGAFYLRRIMQDDLTEKVHPKTVLDPVLMIYRVTEVIAVGVAILQAAGWDENGVVGFGFRWTNLSGRYLRQWVNLFGSMMGGGKAVENDANSYLEVSLSTPMAAVPSRVAEAIRPLFAKFDGYEVSPLLVEETARKVIERRL